MKRAPVGLGPSGRKFWRAVLSAYELKPGELVILERACRCLDRLARIDDLVTHPDIRPMIKGSVGQLRPNPLYAMAAEQEKLLDVLVRSLALPFPDEQEGKRQNPQQREAAQTRWRALHEERDRARGALAH
jgi:hypothetical protein